ncbi:MaoC family dehydratase [Nocardioides houyundeii]|uniref:MaoC family dehydratase n=1 Tax=Nocardioides houyundeii TaxID=2045452 RepID=UPI000DF3B4F2|nr:MaoC family dehydratase [Nocardioides houyundeii]
MTTDDQPHLPMLEWQVSQDLIDSYAEVSGDRNPLHVDPVFAAQTSFGGTIAHGFLVLAWLSQWATELFGDQWITSGTLEVSFVAPVRPGDVIRVEAERIEDLPGGLAYQVRCVAAGRDVLVGRVSVPATHA